MYVAVLGRYFIIPKGNLDNQKLVIYNSRDIDTHGNKIKYKDCRCGG